MSKRREPPRGHRGRRLRTCNWCGYACQDPYLRRAGRSHRHRDRCGTFPATAAGFERAVSWMHRRTAVRSSQRLKGPAPTGQPLHGAYIRRKTRQGRTSPEIRRSLERYIARQLLVPSACLWLERIGRPVRSTRMGDGCCPIVLVTMRPRCRADHRRARNRGRARGGADDRPEPLRVFGSRRRHMVRLPRRRHG